MHSEARNPKGVCTLYSDSEDKKMFFSRVFGLSFPEGKSGFDMAVELGLTPRIAKLLLDSAVKETSREKERLYGAKCTMESLVDEAEAFYLVLETLSFHWLTCEGELDKTLLLASERLLSSKEG